MVLNPPGSEEEDTSDKQDPDDEDEDSIRIFLHGITRRVIPDFLDRLTYISPDNHHPVIDQETSVNN